MRRTSVLMMCLLVLAVVLAGPQASATNVAVYSLQEYFGVAIANRITSLGYSTVVWTNPSTVTPENLSGVDVLFVVTGFAASLEDQASVIESYVAGGGGLVLEQPNLEGPVAILPPGLGAGVFSRWYDNLNVLITPDGLTHPITAGLTAADIPGNMDTVRIGDISPAYTVLAVGAANPNLVVVAAAVYGKGRVVLDTGNVHPWSLRPGSDLYLRELLDWVGTPTVQTITVAIDIKPGDGPNSINLKSRGVVPVAVLTTPEFDATTVDPATVYFAGAQPVKWIMADVHGDGDLDLLLHFKTQSLDLTAASTEATLTGSTYDGQSIEGTDSVRIVPPTK